MEVFFSVTLGISIVGLILLLFLKRLEMRSGRQLFRGARPAFDRFSHNFLVLIEHVLPTVIRIGVRRIVRAIGRIFHKAVARAVLLFERVLERTLHQVREKTRPTPGNGEASTFLKEVADHKRAILKEKGKHVIFEE